MHSNSGILRISDMRKPLAKIELHCVVSVRNVWRSVLAGVALMATTPCSADVYVSTNGGEARYATQRLDDSYTLFIKSDLPVAPALARVAAPRRAVPPEVKLLIERAAKKHEIDPLLLQAVVHTESRYNARALSPKGAAGYAQLMPGTAKRYGVTDRFDAAQNIDAGARYLKDLLAQFKGNAALALAAYNAGEGRIDQYGKRLPPYKETMLYVPTVLNHVEGLRSEQAAVAAE